MLERTIDGFLDELDSMSKIGALSKIAITAWKRMFPVLGKQMMSARGSFGALARNYGAQLERAAANPSQFKAIGRQQGEMRRLLKPVPTSSTEAAGLSEVATPRRSVETFNERLSSGGRVYSSSSAIPLPPPPAEGATVVGKIRRVPGALKPAPKPALPNYAGSHNEWAIFEKYPHKAPGFKELDLRGILSSKANRAVAV